MFYLLNATFGINFCFPINNPDRVTTHYVSHAFILALVPFLYAYYWLDLKMSFVCFWLFLLGGRTNFYEGASKDIAPQDIHWHGHEYPSYHAAVGSWSINEIWSQPRHTQ